MAAINGVTPKAMPWARKVESRLDGAEKALNALGYNMSTIPDADKTVFSEFTLGQNVLQGVSGRVEPTTPVMVKYASSTGLYEVTVSLSGLVRDGAVLGFSFESVARPYEIYFDIPTYGVVGKAPIGETVWTPFSASFSTVFTDRPGVQELTGYLYANCTAGVNSAAFVRRARLSVKAV